MAGFPRVLLVGTALAVPGGGPRDHDDPPVPETPPASDLVASLAGRGYPVVSTIEDADVVVTAVDADCAPALLEAVQRGVGLVVIGVARKVMTAGTTALAQAGIEFLPQVTGDGEGGAARAGAADAGRSSPGAIAGPEETATVTTEDLLARVDLTALGATGELAVRGPAGVLLRRRVRPHHDPGAQPGAEAPAADGRRRAAGAPIAAVANLGAGRVVALAADIAATPAELVLNMVAWAARRSASPTTARSGTAQLPAWRALKVAVGRLQERQQHDGSVEGPEHGPAAALVTDIISAVQDLAPRFAHDADYLEALVKDFRRWADTGFGVPDFLDSLVAFHPERQRVDGREHLVVFPMYTQNGSTDRHVEAVLVQVIWPDFVGELEAGDYSNKLFVPIRFLDFTAGYDTNAAVLFPETVAMREVPTFTWGAIFADREAARFRTVVSAAASVTRLALPPDAQRLIADQALAEETFVMWDLIHDRTHMHGDLPFDPFMIKQRMPYFLYSLEELRCDLTAFRESVALERGGVPHARLVQYAILFDRIFRFPITGTRVRNYDGLGGQLLFAWLHQHHVLQWTDNQLSVDWDRVADVVLELAGQIELLYWRSIDRPKTAHWLAAYELVSSTCEPNPASVWRGGAAALPVDGPPKGLTDAVLPDEFPLSMFYEALRRKLSDVVESTAGITG